MASKKNGSSNGTSGHKIIHDMSEAEAASMQYRIPMIRLEAYEIEPAVIALVSEELCRAHRIIPVSRAGTSIIIAMIDPKDANAIEAVRAHTGFNVEPVVAAESALLSAMDKYYGRR
jgi:type IV pilus assembly protein PilB